MTRLSPFSAFLPGALLLLDASHPSHADDGIFPLAPVAKASIDFDVRGFLIDGKRTPILSAGMDYAHTLWCDRLLRLKRAGFNCVEMYTFWNWHEPQAGLAALQAWHPRPHGRSEVPGRRGARSV